jgi:hypothetical protein
MHQSRQEIGVAKLAAAAPVSNQLQAATEGPVAAIVNLSQRSPIADPAEAMAFKLRFLREKQDVVEVRKVRSMDESRLALATAADLYFAWKAPQTRLEVSAAKNACSSRSRSSLERRRHSA